MMYNDYAEQIIMLFLKYGALILLIIATIFFIIRGFLCWYWKINKRIDLLESLSKESQEINKSLKLIIENLSSDNNKS